MNKELIVIDPRKVEDKISALQSEIAELQGFLKSANKMRDMAESLKMTAKEVQVPEVGRSEKRGRPPGGGKIYGILKKFIASKTEQFTSADMRIEIGPKVSKFTFSGAIRRLVKEGLIDVISPPIGRRPGVYRTMKPV